MFKNTLLCVLVFILILSLFSGYGSYAFGQEKKESILKRLELLEKLVNDQTSQIGALQKENKELKEKLECFTFGIPHSDKKPGVFKMRFPDDSSCIKSITNGIELRVYSVFELFSAYYNYKIISSNGTNVGIGFQKLEEIQEKLHVNGTIKATKVNTGDINFEKEGKLLWRMFEEEDGLYLQNMKNNKIYKISIIPYIGSSK